MKDICGIYLIVNKVNGKFYIGSSRNILKRWTAHQWRLRENKHHSVYLQRAWNKYKSDNFVLIVIKRCEQNELFAQEDRFINIMSPDYNLGSVGGGDNISNHPNLEEIRKKHSKNTKARYDSMSHEEKNDWANRFSGDGNPNWKGGVSQPKCSGCGKKLGYGHKLCVLCSKLGEQNPFYGKHHSEESKAKIRNKALGRKPANSQRVRIGGIEYQSMSDAAKALSVSAGLISYRFKKKYDGYEFIS